MEPYNHRAIEKKWQKKWEEDRLYDTPDDIPGKNNYYLLTEFSYPSGNLHIGHWYAFAVPDIFARYQRMRGKNVLYPAGFDSFGLPAENAAIKRGLNPCAWTYDNIAHMREQLKSMGNSFDWSREIITSDPEYYRWTQWLFLQFYRTGLVERKKGAVNWCPSCQTVLANEQVVKKESRVTNHESRMENGPAIQSVCERCGTEVIEKEMEQWFMKITDYADRLLAGLDMLDWPEEIKEAQRNWIGRSEGAEIEFRITNHESRITVFTTRPDTLCGVTYLAVAPEHPLIQNQESGIRNQEEVQKYINGAKKKSEIERTAGNKEMTGVELEGLTAINPATKEEIPIWIADYVLGHYGAGAIMGVPGHDERDFAFAKTFNLPMRKVIVPQSLSRRAPSLKDRVAELSSSLIPSNDCWTGEGTLINSGEFDGMSSESAKEKIVAHVGGRMTATYRLRDWLISRQRYWGCPIPIVYDPSGVPHPIPEEHLPWKLPDDVTDFAPRGTSPLGTSRELLRRTEEIFGPEWKPEIDTMDTFIDSSWYFLRYLDPRNEKEFAGREKQKLWMPVDRYSGGAEHTTMHLLYSRFFYHAMSDLGLVGTKRITNGEPYTCRLNRGIILGPDGQKMSKSKGNVIDPDEHVERVGADAVKMYLAFIGPYSIAGHYPWDVGGIAGIRRFLERVWAMRDRVSNTNNESGITNHEWEAFMHKTIKKVGEDIEAFKFNTAISSLMIFINSLRNAEGIPTSLFSRFLLLLAPFAPHLAEELWHSLGRSSSVHREAWPVFDAARAHESEVAIVVQVNGTVRGSLIFTDVPDEERVREAARVDPRVGPRLANVSFRRVVYIPGKLINFVLKSRE